MYVACAYTFFPLFRYWQTNLSLTPLPCTEHIWCKCSNTWEAPAGPSQATLILQQHIHNFLLNLQLLSLTPHSVQCSGDTTMLATRVRLEILFFAVWGMYLSLLRYRSTKIANNKGTVRRSREKWMCIIIQLASWHRRTDTAPPQARPVGAAHKTWQAGPCSGILRQKQF